MKAFRRISIAFIGFLSLMVLLILLSSEDDANNYAAMAFNGEYSEDLPEFSEVKGRGQFSDEVVQLAMGTAVKYRLLPSVILSQWAYESAWGESAAAKSDLNYFGITWFSGCPYPQGSARGVGGSEGGNYMKFPSAKASFSYYGYMVAVQSNFNQCVGNTSPNECLLILGRGGYAAAGITEKSPYYTACMGMIEKDSLTEYDEYAIERWGSEASAVNMTSGKSADVSLMERQLGKALYNGECYGATAYYVDQLGGPTLMGSGKVAASDIGTDYQWSTYGWKVILDPKYGEIEPGDIVNFSAGYGFHTIYGHTGICKSVSSSSVTVYDQWRGHGLTISHYDRPIKSIVRKVN